MKMACEFIARGADLIGMRCGEDRRRNFLGAFVFEPVEPHIGPCPQDVGIDLVRQIFDVEHALVVYGHSRGLSQFGKPYSVAGLLTMMRCWVLRSDVDAGNNSNKCPASHISPSTRGCGQSPP